MLNAHLSFIIGKYDLNYEDDQQILGDVNVEFASPNSASHTLKFSATGLVGSPQEKLKLSGAVALDLESKVSIFIK